MDGTYWDSVMVETAREHPIAVAVWLVADAGVNALIGLQDSIEGKLRKASNHASRQRQGFKMMKRAFPDLQAHIEDIFGAGDEVAARLRFRGTHCGGFIGIPATGRTVE